jgi:phage shock protein PspC (stress-responsive transcriptional regulator)
MSMRKVITINLNGSAYQVDDIGFEALRSYLDRAEAQLAGNPDRAEIIADLEQAIGDKCDTFLGSHKNVVTAAEVEQLLKEMGPVEGAGPAPAGPASGTAGGPTASAAPGTGAPASDAPGSRKLFRLPVEGMFGGVCAGLAAYFNIDVVWVRLLFVLLAFASGVGFLVWLVLLIVMPRADMPEDIAAAHGEPFNARDVIERAKKKYQEYSGAAASAGREQWEKHGPQMRDMGEDLKRAGENIGRAGEKLGTSFREHARARRQVRAQRRAERRRERYRYRHVGYGAQVAGGVTMPVFSVLSAVLFVTFIFAMISLVTHGTILGWRPLPFLPHWVAIVGLIVCYCIVAGPISAARRASHRYANGGYEHGWASAVGGLLWLAAVVLLFWALYQSVPGFRELIDGLPVHFGHTRTITV